VVKSVVNAHANIDIFRLFLFILASCTSFTMGVFTQHVLNEAYSHYTQENVRTCSHTSLFTPHSLPVYLTTAFVYAVDLLALTAEKCFGRNWIFTGTRIQTRDNGKFIRK